MAGRMQDKVVIVTGAGSVGPGWGNGKASAVTYAREGAKVFCVDRNEAAAAETRAIIEREGVAAVAHACDVADETQVADMTAACRDAFGRIDVLHNNVGIAGLGGPVETTLADWRRVMDVNVTSMFLTCKHVIPLFLAQGGGAIVNISSLSAVKAARPELAYAASKGAVNSLTINIAMESPMVHQAFQGGGAPGEVEAVMATRHALSPTGRMGEGWDVAHAAAYLASDEARYVNGVLLYVDAGLQYRVG